MVTNQFRIIWKIMQQLKKENHCYSEIILSLWETSGIKNPLTKHFVALYLLIIKYKFRLNHS